jgi:hypothetical protein
MTRTSSNGASRPVGGRQVRVVGDHPLDIGVGEAVVFLDVRIALLRVRLLQRLANGHQNLSFERAGLAGKTRGCPVPQADCRIAQASALNRHHRARPGDPRLSSSPDPGTWMPDQVRP